MALAAFLCLDLDFLWAFAKSTILHTVATYEPFEGSWNEAPGRVGENSFVETCGSKTVHTVDSLLAGGI